MTMNLKHSFIIVNTFKRLDGNIEKTVYDYGNVFSTSPFAISIHFIGKIMTNMPSNSTMENEGILRCGWINVRAIFSLEE